MPADTPHPLKYWPASHEAAASVQAKQAEAAPSYEAMSGKKAGGNHLPK